MEVPVWVADPESFKLDAETMLVPAAKMSTAEP